MRTFLLLAPTSAFDTIQRPSTGKCRANCSAFSTFSKRHVCGIHFAQRKNCALLSSYTST